MRLKTITDKLNALGIKEFSKDLDSITYYVDIKEGSIRIDFWNINRVIPCKYNHENTDLLPYGVEILYKKNARIHSNNNDHVLRDIATVSKEDFLNCKDWLDFKSLIDEAQAVGIKLQ